MLPKDMLNKMIEAYREKLANCESDEDFRFYESIVDELEHMRDTGKTKNFDVRIVKVLPITMTNFSDKKRQN